jgi:hypothetical protein
MVLPTVFVLPQGKTKRECVKATGPAFTPKNLCALNTGTSIDLGTRTAVFLRCEDSVQALLSR